MVPSLRFAKYDVKASDTSERTTILRASIVSKNEWPCSGAASQFSYSVPDHCGGGAFSEGGYKGVPASALGIFAGGGEIELVPF